MERRGALYLKLEHPTGKFEMAVPTSSQVTGVANTLLRQGGIPRRVHGIEQCGSVLFGQLYETLTGARPPGGGQSEAERCQAVVDAFSEQLAPHVSLDHIRGADLAARDPLAIINLLDIFSVLFHVPSVKRERETRPPEVLRGELGPAQCHTHLSSSYSTNSTAELLRPLPPELTVMSLTCSSIDQSEPAGEGVPPTGGSSEGQLAPPTTPPPETRRLDSPLHHSTPRTHPTISRIHPPSSVTSFPLAKSTLPAPKLSPSPSPLPLPSASDSGAEEGGVATSTDTLEEHDEVDSPDSTPPDPGNETVPDDSTLSARPEAIPLHRSPAGPPGEAGRRKEILSSLCQHYLRETAGRHGKKNAASRHQGRKAGVKPAGHRSGKPLHTRTNSKKDEANEKKKTQKLGVTSDLFPLVEASLPVCPVSMETIRHLWRKQQQQITTLTKPTPSHPHRVDQEIEAMGRKHVAQLEALKKEIDHTQRLRGQEEARAQQRAVRTQLQARRQATARARRYFRDYELELKRKLQKKRTSEEQVFRQVFEDGLALLREREREVRRFAREKREHQREGLRRDLEAMEQYYSDQFSMLAETLARERQEAAVREKAQAQVSGQLGRELREKLEREVRQLQGCLERDEDITHFRELDAQQLRLALHHLLTPHLSH